MTDRFLISNLVQLVTCKIIHGCSFVLFIIIITDCHQLRHKARAGDQRRSANSNSNVLMPALWAKFAACVVLG